MRRLTLYTIYCLRLTALLAAVCTVAAFLYGALLLMAVAHTARLSVAEAEVRTVAGATGALESAYLAGQKSLTLARAHELGFVEPVQTFVVYALPSALTINR